MKFKSSARNSHKGKILAERSNDRLKEVSEEPSIEIMEDISTPATVSSQRSIRRTSRNASKSFSEKVQTPTVSPPKFKLKAGRNVSQKSTEENSGVSTRKSKEKISEEPVKKPSKTVTGVYTRRMKEKVTEEHSKKSKATELPSKESKGKATAESSKNLKRKASGDPSKRLKTKVPKPNPPSFIFDGNIKHYSSKTQSKFYSLHSVKMFLGCAVDFEFLTAEKFEISTWFHSLGWSDYLSKSFESYPRLIHQFYANLRETQINDETVLQTCLGHEEITLSIPIFNEILNLQGEGTQWYGKIQLPMPNEVYNFIYETAFCLFSGLKEMASENDYLEINQLLVPFKILHKIVRESILPRDNHSTAVTNSEVVVMWCIVQQKNLDLAYLIGQHMLYCCKKSFLGYGSLITLIAKSFEVDLKTFREIIPAAIPIGPTKLRQLQLTKENDVWVHKTDKRHRAKPTPATSSHENTTQTPGPSPSNQNTTQTPIQTSTQPPSTDAAPVYSTPPRETSPPTATRTEIPSSSAPPAAPESSVLEALLQLSGKIDVLTNELTSVKGNVQSLVQETHGLKDVQREFGDEMIGMKTSLAEISDKCESSSAKYASLVKDFKNLQNSVLGNVKIPPTGKSSD